MTTAPEADLRLLEATADSALANYAQRGGFPPFCMMQTGGDTMLLIPSKGFPNQDAKYDFVNFLRYASIENQGLRAAFAMENWTVFSKDPADHALLEEIYARGGSMSEHPNVGEAITVIVESDAGTTMRMHRIVRDGDNVTLEAAETDFESAGTRKTAGVLSGFHIPTGMQGSLPAQTFAAEMRRQVTTAMHPIEPYTPAKPN